MIQDSLRTLIAEAEQFDGVSPISDQALLAADQGRRTIVHRSIQSDDTSADAFDTSGDVLSPPIDAVGIFGQGEIDLVVRPSARGKGLGHQLLSEMMTRAQGESPGELRAWSHGENPAAQALLSGAGFTPIRTLFRLALDPAQLPEAVQSARPMPAGFRVESFADADSVDRSAEWVAVNAAAFADHPEQGAVTLEDFQALTRQDWFDPADLLFAIDESTSRIAGYGWIKTVRGDELETELYVLGVDPAYAGHGIGAALFGETLRRMLKLAPHRITLYVDESNANAVALYIRGGFEIDQRSTQWLFTATHS